MMHQIASILTPGLFGTHCQLCFCALDRQESWICNYCAIRLPSYSRGCITCAQPIPTFEKESPLSCGKCLKTQPAINRLTSCYYYQYPIDKWLTRFKFGRRHAYSQWLAKQLFKRIEFNDRALPEAIIPVPLHTKRLKYRGFNQSQLIANHLASMLNLPVITKGIQRKKSTLAQSGLSMKQRQNNIRDAFQVTTHIPEHVAIVDDVFTTGSTTNELAKCLKRAGSNIVEAWVIAHAPNR
ncbi:ComF family protein [Pleionea sediminis]|uniref:ComF family protein n=1 Tax=Pleionea sediminis TaxID=2569479 RepID=UPI00118652D1|nr:ComF family protein [Pleionea sediminis]